MTIKMISTKKMTEILKIAKKFDLKRVKMGEIEFELFEKQVGISDGLKTQDIPKERMPTEDEMLYWSSPYDPRAEREEAEKELEKALQPN